MIEALKSEDVVDKVGGRFKLCVLIQKRIVELMDGARPLVERNGRTDLEVVIDEILQEKISVDYSRTELPEDCTPEVLLPPGFTPPEGAPEMQLPATES